MCGSPINSSDNYKIINSIKSSYNKWVINISLIQKMEKIKEDIKIKGLDKFLDCIEYNDKILVISKESVEKFSYLKKQEK